MKRLLLILAGCLFTVFYGFSQKVDSIKVEQSGDFVKIRYKILNSTPDQVYRVRILCSINGGLNQEIKTVTGDVGEQVMGGKSEYWVVWDVLKDVEELTSAEFVVRAELVNNNISSSKPKKNNKAFSLQPVLQLPGPGFGARFGYMGKAGISLLYTNSQAVIHGDNDYDGDPRISRFGIELTVRLSDRENTQIHLIAGPTVSQCVIEDTYQGNTSYPVHLVPGLEGGLAICAKSIVFSATFSKLLVGMVEEGEGISQTSFLTAGFGFRF